jgi:hypothetical protein
MFAKKSLGLGLLIGLLAMAFAALPAMASAATLTEEGEPVQAGPEGVGATVTATSTNAVTVLEGPLGPVTIKCEKVAVHGIVTVNSGGVVKISMEKEKVDTATGCTANGVSTTITPTLEEINLSGSSGTAKFTFTGGGLNEASTSTVSWVGPNATSAHVAGPVTGTLSGTFSGDFTFETGATEPLTLD